MVERNIRIALCKLGAQITYKIHHAGNVRGVVSDIGQLQCDVNKTYAAVRRDNPTVQRRFCHGSRADAVEIFLCQFVRIEHHIFNDHVVAFCPGILVIRQRIHPA